MQHQPGEMELFDPSNYPELQAEVAGIIRSIANTSSNFRSEIIISYLKDHSIKAEWLESNPAISSMVISGTLKGANTEKLFMACQWNKRFRKDLELYLKESFSTAEE